MRRIRELVRSKRVLRQVGRYSLSMIVSACVTVALPILLHEMLGITQKVAVAISQSLALLLNFLMIRMFVFASKRTAHRDVLYFLGSAAAFRGLEYVGFLALFQIAHLYYVTALALTLAVSTVLKFFWYRFLFGRGPVEVAEI